jgi:hypothetical protein
MAPLTASGVGKCASGDPIAPGESRSGWGVVESTPGGQQDVAEYVICPVGLDAPSDVTLEWIEDFADDCLEPLPAVDC